MARAIQKTAIAVEGYEQEQSTRESNANRNVLNLALSATEFWSQQRSNRLPSVEA